MFLKFSENVQENTCFGVSFLIKLQLYKKEAPTQVFLFFYITPPDNRVCHFLHNSGKCQNKGNVVTPWVKFVAFWEVTL